jgi:hypothetical protein
MSNEKRSSGLFRGPNTPRKHDREPMIEAALKAFFGFSKVALGEEIYQTDFLHPVHAGED